MSQYDDHIDIDDSNSVAIIGMAGRFPEAADLDAFWRNLREGVESVLPITDDELRKAGVDEETLQSKNYIKVASMLSDIELFDAEFFGISPREAEVMDPQQRLFLECAWEAVEHAGYDVHNFPGAIGLYAGTAMSSYLFENILSNRRVLESVGDRQVLMVNEKDFLCGRAAYEMNLRGPAVLVQTACSTSLVAVHMACQSLLNGECDMALAGGVSIQSLEKRGYLYSEGGLLSADGHCRAFDAKATGIVGGNGLGLVVLKSLAAARADGDTIHAIIRGSAINNDGKDKASFTAPSVDGQAAVIREAQAMAGVPVETITYIEAHGTGTMLGDPIEMGALKQAFATSTDKKQYCAMGSLKTNVGHLDVAAGVAGLIKTVLALKHQEIPPSLHFTKPNPHIDFKNSPFFVNTKLTPWRSADSPRRAGVSSFGIGGTNAHVIVEEAPRQTTEVSSQSCHLLVLSAKTPTALQSAATNLIQFLSKNPDTNLADVAYTLQRGRQHFSYRRSVSCTSIAGAIESLKQPVLTPAVASLADGETPPIVFMFPGGGTQYIGMGQSLYQSESVFRNVIDECADILLPILELDIRSLLFPDAAQAKAAAAKLDQTHMALPALFAVEYGLAKQLNAWGIQASAMIGHSLGEYVAACLAGVFSLNDGLAIVAERGRLISSLPTGNMVAVLLPAQEIQPRLSEGLWLACENTQQACTISGTPEATERLAEELKADGVDFQLLRTWPGSHSGLMEPILEQFRRAFSRVKLHAPQRPYLSNLSGDWITAEQATDPDYWINHLRHTVRFAGGLSQLRKNPANIYVEVGPGHTLSNLLKRDVGTGKSVASVTTLPRRDAEGCSMLSAMQSLGQLWANGAVVDWNLFYGSETRRRIPLPTYPFERKRYWLERRPLAAWSEPAEGISQSMATDAQQQVGDRSTLNDALSKHVRPSLPTEFVAAQSETEQTLCAIWESLLGIAPIGVHDNFFLLGGSSLVAIQLASRIRTTFHVDMPLRNLFETPTVIAQAEEIEHRKNAASDNTSVIRLRSPEAPVPLSFAQQRLWFIDQLDHASSVAFHIPAALRLKGHLNKSALKATLDRIVARHESLRTTFSSVDGHAMQIIAPPDSGFSLRSHDLGALHGLEQELAVNQLSKEETLRPFDLMAGPLIRAQLLCLAEDEHILLITQHHIISDGWSIGVLIQEVSTLYAAFSQGLNDPLPMLSLQYADYAAWQRELLQGDVLQARKNFWKTYLAGAPELLSLPTDRPRPVTQSYDGGLVQLTLSTELTSGLKALSQRHGTTIFMTLLAGWSALLARLSGQPDIVVGTPVANRQRDEVEALIGFFVNTLALRVNASRDSSIADLLRHVKASTLQAYEHQDLPFDQVVEAIQPARSMSHTPLFQVLLNLHNTPNYRELSLPGLSLSGVELEQNTTQYDLMLSLTDAGNEIGGDIRYVKALFDGPTVERMVEQFQRLLAAMVADDTQRVGDIDLLGKADRHRILVEFNATQMDFPEDQLIHQLFEAQVLAQPDATALVFADQALSYGELNQRANRLAHYLIGLGVKPDDRVAIYIDRSIEMIVGLLGILKSGAAYVPLDPNYPAERLAYMISDSAPAAVLTRVSLEGNLPALTVPLVRLDAQAAAIDAQPDSNPEPMMFGLKSHHLAYVIYTSGSTGQPKGVMLSHRNAVNFITWALREFSAEQLAHTLFSTSFNFDLSIYECFVPLACGTRLTLVGNALSLLQQTTDVTLINTVPSAIEALVDAGAVPVSVRTINLAGEALKGSLVEKIFAKTQVDTVCNLYGPSETTTYSTWIGMSRKHGFVPHIGRPVANTQIYILDPDLKPVPLGVTGELYIGGAGVARGYLNRAELTAERFIRDPFHTESDSHMYKTGDLGKWLADGNIEYLGRNDFQVKIRGFRIELGEIESVLLSYPEIREAVVMAREDQPGDKRLVAYLVLQAGCDLSVELLRAYLSKGLADFMIPSAFVTLSALPLTPNGKLDRGALPAPDGGSVIARRYEAPQGRIEQAIAGIWQELLGLEQVGRYDQFFELGGHSLMASQLVTRIRESLGINIPLAVVFQTSSLAMLAEAVLDVELSQYEISDIEQVVADIDGLTDEEVERLLVSERQALDV